MQKAHRGRRLRATCPPSTTRHGSERSSTEELDPAGSCRHGLAQLVVPILSEDPSAVGNPARLFETAALSGGLTQTLVAPGGERFLVQNWLQELERLVPAK